MSLEPHLAMVGWEVLLNPVPKISPYRPVEEGSTIMSTKRKQGSLLWTRICVVVHTRNLDESNSAPKISVWHGDQVRESLEGGDCAGNAF